MNFLINFIYSGDKMSKKHWCSIHKVRNKLITELNLKQKKFADKYIETGNITQSYLFAYGGNVKNAEAHGNRLVRNGKVQEYLNKRMKKIEELTEMTEDELFKLLTEHGRGRTKEARQFIVKKDKNTEELIEKKCDIYIKDQLTALKEIHKRYLVAKPTKTENVNINHSTDNEYMSIKDWYNSLTDIEKNKSDDELIEDYEQSKRNAKNS